MDTTSNLAAARATVLAHENIDDLPAEPLGHLQGAFHRVLWRDATSMSGVLTVLAGHRLGRHSHRVNHHHFWVLDGEATVLGKRLGPGSYVHIPSGVEHDIDATASGGCTVFYLYIRLGTE